MGYAVVTTPVGTPFLNDAMGGGIYTGGPVLPVFDIKIDATGTPDTFKWKKDAGSYTTGISITGSAQTLSDGVTVTFGATTGHHFRTYDLSGYAVGTPSLDDISAGLDGPYSGYDAATWDVEIDGGDPTSPNTFKWRKNADSWTTGVEMTPGVNQSLTDNVIVVFTNGVGHTTGDAWHFTMAVVSNEDEWTLSVIRTLGTPQDVGIRQPVYLGGYVMALPPNAVKETPFRAETAERMSNAFTVIDRPYLFAGAPDVVQKFTWALEWPSVNAADYYRFAEIESLPGFFDFTLWKPIFETFSGNGSSTQFRLLRRLANVSLTPPSGIDWTPIVKVDGSLVTPDSFGSPDGLGTVIMTLPSAPSATASNVRVCYTPLFMVRVVSPTRDFGIPFAESRSLTLEEF